MHVRFFGVRGSIAVCGSTYVRTGGNTACVEVTSGDHRLILDGGTGLRSLGDQLGFKAIDATVLFSHVHWDHIQGVPFFTPAYHPQARLTFMGTRRDSGSLRDALDAQMRPPTFPVTLEALRAAIRFVEIDRDVPFEHGPFRITPVDLNHPDGVLAYRIEADGKAVVYATDIEHGDRLDERVCRVASGADLLIHDAQYTQDEYAGTVGPARRGWGHSTLGDALGVARSAGVDRLALFHHDPQRGDDSVDAFEGAARALFPRAFAAREGDVVAL